MSATAAGSILMWMAGVMVGVGVAGEDLNPSLMIVGTLMTVFGIFYIRLFAEK